MRIDLQRAPQSLRCSRVVAFMHRFPGLFEVCVQLYFLGSWGRCVVRQLRLSQHAMRDQQPHRAYIRDLPGANLHLHMPNSNSPIDMLCVSVCDFEIQRRLLQPPV